MRVLNKILFALSCTVMAQSAYAQQASDGVVKIGILNDQSGVYADFGGKSSVEAARMAVQDFGGKVLGAPVEIVSADHQMKTDVGLQIVRGWFDNGKVDAVADIFQAYRIELVKHCRGSFRIPPVGGQPAEMGGFARIDLRLDELGNVWVLEANPNPQIAKGEDFAASADKIGISYESLLQRIVNLGLRWQPESFA